MLEKIEILFVVLFLLLVFYIVIAWGSKQKKKTEASLEIKNYLFGVRVLILIMAVVSFILWIFL